MELSEATRNFLNAGPEMLEIAGWTILFAIVVYGAIASIVVRAFTNPDE